MKDVIKSIGLFILSIAAGAGVYLVKYGDNLLKTAKHADDYSEIIEHSDELSKLSKKSDEMLTVKMNSDYHSEISKKTKNIENKIINESIEQGNSFNINKILSELDDMPLFPDDIKRSSEFTRLELTTNGFKIIGGKELTESQLKEIIKIRPKIVLKGELTDKYAGILRNIKAHIVFNENSIVQMQKQKLHFIFASSLDETSIYDIFNKASKLQNTSLVCNAEDLKKSIQTAHEIKRRPILVFDNKNSTLFENNIADYNVSEVITCNSYQITNANLSLSTTNYVNAKDVILSIQKSCLHESEYLDDFFLKFAKNYQEIQIQRTKKYALIYFGAGTTTTGGISSIIYLKD